MDEGVDRCRALIVEDDAELRQLTCEMLQQAELATVAVEDAETALTYLREHAPDVALVFADIRLAGRLDGADLARCISARWPWIAVLLTSGDPGDRLRDLPRGAVYMPKPWRERELLAYAERALQNPRSVAVGTPW